MWSGLFLGKMGELFTRKKGLLRYILESRKNNRKKYARKMEFLDKVRDGSEDAIGRGILAIEGDSHGSGREANGSAC